MLPIEYYIETHIVEDKEILMQRAICNEFNITIEQMLSKNKRKEISTSRYVYYYLAWKHNYFNTLQEIGESVGREYSTVSHGITVTKPRIGTDHNFTRKLTRIEKKLNL